MQPDLSRYLLAFDEARARLMSAVVTDPFAAMRGQIERIAQRDDVPAEEKLMGLRSMESDLTSLLGLIGRYRGDLHLEQEARGPLMQEAVLTIREGAVIRDTLLAREMFTADELDEFGLLSHEDIARLDEEGLLEAWIEESFAGIVYDELKHPRGRGGKFTDVLGREVKMKGRGGKAIPSPKSPEPAPAAAAKEPKPKGPKEPSPSKPKTPPKPKLADTLKEIEQAGLDGWPPKGDEATRLLGDAKDTQEAHTVQVRGKAGTRYYTPERQQLHNRIIDTLLRKRMEVPNSRGDGEMHPDPNGEFLTAPTEGRRVLFLAGATASGKTSALGLPENAEVLPPDAVHIDPDEIKAMIPEYVQMVRAKDRYAASGVHEESSDIAKRLRDEAVSRGLNMIVDGTGDSGSGKFASKMTAAKAEGYDVHVFYVNAPVEVALERAVTRAQRTGRWVPESEIRTQHEQVSARFPEIRKLVEDGTINDIKMFQTEAAPVLMASGGNGSFNVHDPALLDEFVAKAKPEAAPK